MSTNEIKEMLCKNLSKSDIDYLTEINKDGTFKGAQPQNSDDYYRFNGKIIDNVMVIYSINYCTWPSDVYCWSVNQLEKVRVISQNGEISISQSLTEVDLNSRKNIILELYSNYEQLIPYVNGMKDIKELQTEYPSCKINKSNEKTLK